MDRNDIWNKKKIWIIPVYGILYMAAFIFLEKSNTEPHMIHSFIDDQIPFCEYFIIPYLLWFVYVACVLWYFTFRQKRTREYYQLIATLGTGMTIFIITCFVYPSGQTLRPELTGDGMFLRIVGTLYRLDTPTNVLPSMHVFCSSACWLALYEHCRTRMRKQKYARKIRKQKRLLAGVGLLTVAIILSTVFLKQHSVIDVAAAILLNIICYQMYYKLIPMRYRKRTPSVDEGESVFYF